MSDAMDLRPQDVACRSAMASVLAEVSSGPALAMEADFGLGTDLAWLASHIARMPLPVK